MTERAAPLPERSLTIAERRKLLQEGKAVSRPEPPSSTRQEELRIAALARAEAVRALVREQITGEAQRFLGAVHPEVLTHIQPSHLSSEAEAFNQELDADPIFAAQYRQILLENNYAALQEKTKKQIQELEGRYFFDRSPSLPPTPEAREEHLALFQALVRDMRPVRAERRQDIDTLLSPRQLGFTSSFGGQDPFVQADAYVYASFNYIRHPMARDGNAVLDEAEAQARGQIVMQDIANMGTAGLGNHDHRYHDYLTNTFDYAGGKEVLALYLAMVFHNPQEAVQFFKTFSGVHYAQHWLKEETVPGMDEEQITPHFTRGRVRKITKQMRLLMEQTHIQPPVSLEVRLPGSARIIRREHPME
jgi:hypothetical protein